MSDFAVLEALLHKGAQPVNVIGKRVFLTSGSITTAIDRLEFTEPRSANAPSRRSARPACSTYCERVSGSLKTHSGSMLSIWKKRWPC